MQQAEDLQSQSGPQPYCGIPTIDSVDDEEDIDSSTVSLDHETDPSVQIHHKPQQGQSPQTSSESSQQLQGTHVQPIDCVTVSTVDSVYKAESLATVKCSTSSTDFQQVSSVYSELTKFSLTVFLVCTGGSKSAVAATQSQSLC